MQHTNPGTEETITLTPSLTLRFKDSKEAWQRKLFELGAGRPDGFSPVALFWHTFAAACVNSLCHAAMPDEAPVNEADTVRKMPFSQDSAALLDSAPPMPGGEYLDERSLHEIWFRLLDWCAEQITAYGGIYSFLEHSAPGWRHVGRVFFHLGENRADNIRPFAFLATYAAGLNENGRLRHIPLAKALKHYSDKAQIIIRLLEPVRRAADAIPWVHSMCDSGAIYQPQAWTPNQAYKFLLSSAELEKQGIGVRLPDWWKKRPRVRIQTEISTRKDSSIGLAAILDFDMSVALGDETLDENEISNLLKANSNGLVLVKNQWIEVDSGKLQQALNHWRKVKKTAAAGGLTFIQGMRLLAGMDDFSEDSQVAETIKEWSCVKAGEDFRKLLSKAGKDDEPDNIPGLAGQLRPYQLKGVCWMRFLNRLNLGACLADDMGLGKTIQIISLLLLEKDQVDMPALLVAPASLMANWKAECARFAPDLRILVLHPSEITNLDADQFLQKEKLRAHDLVITSYAMCARMKWMAEIEWSRIIADEAQNIKNSHTKQSIALRKLRSPRRVALTGTPIENSANDLWALFDFINPGLLGNFRQFGQLLKKLRASSSGLAPLRRITAPYILRRMKTDKKIAPSLPDKTEVILYCNLGKEQAKLYQQVVNQMKKELEKLGGQEDKSARNMAIFRNLILLKQICNHPAQAGFGGITDYDPSLSGKFLRVGGLCSEIASRQERALIFTQFREIIAPLSKYLTTVFGASGLALHGQTPVKKRIELVNEFQKEDGPPFFILSLKAGGSGLTLTRASHVIHFDRWWNPSVEDQATDRAFRIGQNKNVLIHKCLTLGTLEEKINALIESKKSLSKEILDGMESDITSMSNAQILKLVSLDARQIME